MTDGDFNWSESLRPARWERPALVVGVIGVIASIAGAFTSHDQFFRSYLVALVFVASLSIGSLAILMIQYLTGGVWGILLRRPLEAATRLMPIVALMFVPLFFGMHSVYEWTHAEVVAADELLRHKAPYLNTGFFWVRTAIYFFLWFLAASLLNRWSEKQEAIAESPSQARGLRKRHTSAVGLLIMALTLTFASVDWIMSITPHWFSTMFGISFMIGCALTAFSFATIVATSLASHEPIAEIVVPRNFRDLGNLMFAFVMLWAYTGFSEFMLIWYANIQEEVPWYLRRLNGGWGWVTASLLLFHFFVPFMVLLHRSVKDHPKRLAWAALWILVMRAVYDFWLVAPSYSEHLSAHWLDVSTIAGLFGIWLFLYIGQLKKRPLLPLYEPHVRGAMTHV